MKFWYLEIFLAKIQFCPIFPWKSAFSGRPCLKTSLWRHTLADFQHFAINGKGRPSLYYGTTHSYFGHVNLKFMRGVVTTPLRKMCYGKYLRKTRVKQKTRWNSDIQNFYSEILNFRLFWRKKSQFSSIFRCGMSLWRHNYVTPWPIVLILACMNRKGPYLPIDTKINFIGGSVRKI